MLVQRQVGSVDVGLKLATATIESGQSVLGQSSQQQQSRIDVGSEVSRVSRCWVNVGNSNNRLGSIGVGSKFATATIEK